MHNLPLFDRPRSKTIGGGSVIKLAEIGESSQKRTKIVAILRIFWYYGLLEEFFSKRSKCEITG